MDIIYKSLKVTQLKQNKLDRYSKLGTTKCITYLLGLFSLLCLFTWY